MGRGYPHPRSGAGGICRTPPRLDGVPPVQDWMGYPPVQDWMVYPSSQDWMGYPSPRLDGLSPIQDWMGYPPPIRRLISKASTCYAAGGVPLAFRQEDFLVNRKFGVLINGADILVASCTFYPIVGQYSFVGEEFKARSYCGIATVLLVGTSFNGSAHTMRLRQCHEPYTVRF